MYDRGSRRPANEGRRLPARAAHHHRQTAIHPAVNRGASVKEHMLYTSWKKGPAHTKRRNKTYRHPPNRKALSTLGSTQAYLHGLASRRAHVSRRLQVSRRSHVNPLIRNSLRRIGIKSLSKTPDHSARNLNTTSSPSVLIEDTQNDKSLLLSRIEEIRSQGFVITDDGALVVYTDGSAKGGARRRGGPTRAGCGVWWGESGKAHECRLSERVPGPSQTSSRAEFFGIIRALETCPYPDVPLEIRTDSLNSVNNAYHLMAPWLGRGIPGLKGHTRNDRKLVVHLFALLSLRRPGNGVRFAHVRAHQGEFGNEWADYLAGEGTKLPAEPDREWLTMKDLRKRKAEKALRMVPNDKAASTATVVTTVSEIVEAEIVEVEKVLSVEVEADPNLELQPERDEALAEGEVIMVSIPDLKLQAEQEAARQEQGVIMVLTPDLGLQPEPPEPEAAVEKEGSVPILDSSLTMPTFESLSPITYKTPYNNARSHLNVAVAEWLVGMRGRGNRCPDGYMAICRNK